MTDTAFINAWNLFTDGVLCGYRCRICRRQIEIVRAPADGFAIGLLCSCSAATVHPYFAQDEMNRERQELPDCKKSIG